MSGLSPTEPGQDTQRPCLDSTVQCKLHVSPDTFVSEAVSKMLHACHQSSLMPLWLPDMSNVLPTRKAAAHTGEARLRWVHYCLAGALQLSEMGDLWWARQLVGYAVPLTLASLLGSPHFRCLHFLHSKRQLCLALPCMSNLVATKLIPTNVCGCVLTMSYGPSCMSTGTQHILLIARRVLSWHGRRNASDNERLKKGARFLSSKGAASLVL